MNYVIIKVTLIFLFIFKGQLFLLLKVKIIKFLEVMQQIHEFLLKIHVVTLETKIVFYFLLQKNNNYLLLTKQKHKKIIIN